MNIKDSPEKIARALNTALGIVKNVTENNLCTVKANFDTYLENGFTFEVDELKDCYQLSEGYPVTLQANQDDTYKAYFNISTTEFYISFNKSDLEYFHELFEGDYRYIPIKRDVRKMTVQELIENGADVQINYYFCKSESHALEIHNQFLDISELDYFKANNTNWITAKDEEVKITTFYEEDKHESK